MLILRGSVACALVLFGSMCAHAEPTYIGSFEGTLNNVPEQLADFFDPGALVFGSYTWNGGLPPREGSLNDAAVYDNLLTFRLEIDRKDSDENYVAKMASSFDGREIQIVDGHPGNEFTDRLLVLALRSSGLSGPILNGFVIDSTGPHFEDSTNAAISGIVIPTSINLDAFDLKTIGITFTDSFPTLLSAGGDVGAADFIGFDATITSFDVRLQQVPEPSSLVLLTTALGTLTGVFLVRRRRSGASGR